MWVFFSLIFNWVFISNFNFICGCMFIYLPITPYTLFILSSTFHLFFFTLIWFYSSFNTVLTNSVNRFGVILSLMFWPVLTLFVFNIVRHLTNFLMLLKLRKRVLLLKWTHTSSDTVISSTEESIREEPNQFSSLRWSHSV